MQLLSAEFAIPFRILLYGLLAVLFVGVTGDAILYRVNSRRIKAADQLLSDQMEGKTR